MALTPFDPAFEALPDTVPVFPLPGALLLPGGRLPLNIFEPRYLAMIGDAMAGDRLIGLIQPVTGEAREQPRLFDVGCLGRVINFAETDDGRYVITLKGLVRFHRGGEQPMVKGYRVVAIETAPYRADYEAEARAAAMTSDLADEDDDEADVSSDINPPPPKVDRERLFAALEVFTARRQIKVDWDSLRKAGNEALVTTLAMVCPFAPEEKQALLEAPDLTERTRILIAMIEMAVLEAVGDAPSVRH